MCSLKYPEKRFLCSYELTSKFFDNLSLKVYDIIPVRKVFILKTDQGKKILKKIDYSKERLNFIIESVDAIKKVYPDILTFNSFADGKKYIDWKGSCYILMDLIEGREAAFTNPIEFEKATQSLALMHRAGESTLSDGMIEKNLDNDLIWKYKDAACNIQHFEDMVSGYKYKNQFDNIFLRYSKECLDDINESISKLKKGNYLDYRNKKKNICICHNDLAEHNFLYNEDKMYIIDFDYCSVDIRAVDIADILLKGIKNAAFDFNKALKGIEAYNKVYPLDKEEYYYIYCILSFPRDVYDISLSYYMKQKNWDEDVFINRLKTKIENEKFRKEFLEEFKKYYSF